MIRRFRVLSSLKQSEANEERLVGLEQNETNVLARNNRKVLIPRVK